MSFLKKLLFYLLISHIVFSCNNYKQDVESQEVLVRLVLALPYLITDNSLKIKSYFFLQPEAVGNIQNDSISINVPTGTDITTLKQLQ